MSPELAMLLNQLRDKLHQALGNDLLSLILYGSYARDEAHFDSDVDLLLVLRRLTPELDERVSEIAYRVMWDADFAYIFSLNVIDQAHQDLWKRENASFLRNVERDGKVLWPQPALL